MTIEIGTDQKCNLESSVRVIAVMSKTCPMDGRMSYCGGQVRLFSGSIKISFGIIAAQFWTSFGHLLEICFGVILANLDLNDVTEQALMYHSLFPDSELTRATHFPA